DDTLRTSDPEIFAIGEIALHRNMIYGLVAPGYEMADTLAANLTGATRAFNGADLSTKLKLMGVDVASFGDTTAVAATTRTIMFEDPFQGVDKKLIFGREGTRLLGGILVGDASDYGTLLVHYRSPNPLPLAPGELLLGTKQGKASGSGPGAMADDAQ